ncbi:MAG: hypothetical protein FRX49_03402 [Trebouxia sp. A1-2]|nr:MAG: hypothetical protein FRX49_12912 [Trebouxia sp. A1-2]KAA6426291.1 MAG: hypothetical protein FRX49_03402 [Trebouxia sp. A1-2]
MTMTSAETQDVVDLTQDEEDCDELVARVGRSSGLGAADRQAADQQAAEAAQVLGSDASGAHVQPRRPPKLQWAQHLLESHVQQATSAQQQQQQAHVCKSPLAQYQTPSQPRVPAPNLTDPALHLLDHTFMMDALSVLTHSQAAAHRSDQPGFASLDVRYMQLLSQAQAVDQGRLLVFLEWLTVKMCQRGLCTAHMALVNDVLLSCQAAKGGVLITIMALTSMAAHRAPGYVPEYVRVIQGRQPEGEAVVVIKKDAAGNLPCGRGQGIQVKEPLSIVFAPDTHASQKFSPSGAMSHSNLANHMKHKPYMCINPIYLEQCNDAELRSLSANGLLRNSGLQQNQASNCMTTASRSSLAHLRPEAHSSNAQGAADASTAGPDADAVPVSTTKENQPQQDSGAAWMAAAAAQNDKPPDSPSANADVPSGAARPPFEDAAPKGTVQSPHESPVALWPSFTPPKQCSAVTDRQTPASPNSASLPCIAAASSTPEATTQASLLPSTSPAPPATESATLTVSPLAASGPTPAAATASAPWTVTSGHTSPCPLGTSQQQPQPQQQVSLTPKPLLNTTATASGPPKQAEGQDDGNGGAKAQQTAAAAAFTSSEGSGEGGEGRLYPFPAPRSAQDKLAGIVSCSPCAAEDSSHLYVFGRRQRTSADQHIPGPSAQAVPMPDLSKPTDGTSPGMLARDASGRFSRLGQQVPIAGDVTGQPHGGAAEASEANTGSGGHDAMPVKQQGVDSGEEDKVQVDQQEGDSIKSERQGQEVACSAPNLMSMLLPKPFVKAVWALDLYLSEVEQQGYKSILEDAFVLVRDRDQQHLVQVKACHPDHNMQPVFTIQNGEEVRFEELSDAVHFEAHHVRLHQVAIITGKLPRLLLDEVAHANMEARIEQSVAYFELQEQLKQAGLDTHATGLD